MIGPLQTISSLCNSDQCNTLTDAIRWACILEATAPKAGNVYPGRSFPNLNYSHFVQAAEIASDHLTRFDQPLGQRILGCVRTCRTKTETNVNLGIVLLIAPLAESAHTRRSIDEVLSSLHQIDGQQIFEAIRIAGAGGLGRVDEMDVSGATDSIDVLAAMRFAADRDRIAYQYADSFSDLYENVVPLLSDAIQQCGDVLGGICDAHLQMLAAGPDSLIARKFGLPVAKQVQQRASDIDHSDPILRKQFDDWLRCDGNSLKHQLNPGTTADLIAAALFVLLIPPT